VGRFGTAPATTIGQLTEELLAAPCYLAPLPAEAAVHGPWAMPAISARLRAPDGCPWDREQTHESLRRHLLEEAYEVYDALADGPSPALAGELGDLLLQIVLHAQLAAEAGVFDLTDVHAAIATKIVRRHPHVFGEAEARTASDVNRQWERIKAEERADAEAAGSARKGALDGISGTLPALAASQEMQERAANVGYDWPSIEGVLDKVVEEVEELRGAADTDDPEAWAEEFGDLLFVLVNVARKRGVEAEAAMRAANAKFRRRFGSVERQAADRGAALRDLDFETLDALWDAAKAEERTTA
jgi:tetrapyrrole methylase family protein/MazG family protein